MTKPDETQAKDGLDDSPDINVTVNRSDASDSGVSGSASGMTFVTRQVPLPEKEQWFKTYWRPAAAWLYLFINLFDFVIGPVITMILPKVIGGTYVPWLPLTLTNGGMFHLAFGAIIGVTAWGRTRERQAGLIE